MLSRIIVKLSLVAKLLFEVCLNPLYIKDLVENRAKTCHSGTRKKREKKVLVKSKLFVFYFGGSQNLYLEKSLGG